MGAIKAKAILLVVAACYLVQIVTPLRLHPDTVVLLSMAESAAHGGGFLHHGQPTVFPPGYPALLALFFKLDVHSAWLFIAINLAFLVVGMAATGYMLTRVFFEDRRTARTICMLSLVSVVFVKYFSIPLTDLCFFGVAMWSVAVLGTARLSPGPGFLWRLLAGVAGIAASVALRRVGIALLPALLWTVFSHWRAKRSELSRGTKWTALILAGGALIVTAAIVAQTSTLRDFGAVTKGRTLPDVAIHTLGFRLQELGEIAANIPPVAHSRVASLVFPAVGALALSSVLAGLLLRRRDFGPAEVFFAGYLGILVTWPFYDPRFWLPVIPLAAAYAWIAVRRLFRGRPPGEVMRIYGMLFAVLGLIWLGSNIKVAFSGSRFPDAYLNTPYRATYCAAYRSCAGGFDPREVDPDGLHLLEAFR